MNPEDSAEFVLTLIGLVALTLIMALAVHWLALLGANEAAWLGEHLTWPFR